MFAQNPQQQQPLPNNGNLYPFPQQQWQQTPQTGDSSIDGAAKLLDLIERMNARRAGNAGETANFEAGQTQSGQLNAAMFQALPQEQLARQEMALRLPQMPQQQQQNERLDGLQSLQNLQNQLAQLSPQQFQASLPTFLNQLNRAAQDIEQQSKKQQQLGSLTTQAYNQLAALVPNLMQYGRLGEITNTLANEQAKMMDAMMPYVVLAPQSQQLANDLYAELETAKEIIGLQKIMMTHPLVLIELAFHSWMNNIGADDEEFVGLISELYMQLVKLYEDKLKEKTGQYSPTYSQYLQSEVGQQNQAFQVPVIQPGNIQQNQNQDSISALKQFSQALNQPGIGKLLQRQHSQMRQNQVRQ